MHLYRHISAPRPFALGQDSPAIGVIVNGRQELKEDVAGNIMMFLSPRYFMLDPENTGVAGSTGYVAVTAEKFVASGAQLEGQRTAGQQLGELSAQYIALANVGDTMAVLQGQPPELYHIVVVDSQAAAQTIAQPGSMWAVLQPRGASGGQTTTPTTTTKSGLSSATILGAVAGGVVGFLVGGPVGALVGGVALGAIVNASQK